MADDQPNFTDLPLHWQKYIRELRAENGKLRIERNQSREAAAALALRLAGA
jgi:hypothetical protein